jgi:hypothetical protein
MVNGTHRRTAGVCAAIAACAIGLAGAAGAAEPDNDFATATGPLTAGELYKSNLETIDDADFQFFYLPDPTQVSVTTINAAKVRGGAEDRGRTIYSILFRGRKGKDPKLVPESATTPLKPGERDKVTLSLLPGKYFIPVGRIDSGVAQQPKIPFRLEIGPLGSTTDSYEIFAARCHAQQRRVDRITHSIKRTERRLAKAKDNDARTRKIVRLKLKLRAKRDKAKDAKRSERFACSIPR